MHSKPLPKDEQVREPVAGEVPAAGVGERAGGTSAHASLPTVEQLLIEAAIQRPEAEALIGSFGSITYADLLIRAQNIAVALRRQGVAPGDLVGVTMDQSPVMVTSIVGVLLAGAAYVPLGRDLLQDATALRRIRSIGMALILCDRSHGTGSCMLWSEYGSILDASRLEQQTMPTSGETSMPSTRPDSPAAVYFRRLAGGDVAGAVVSHRAIARLVSSRRLANFHATETFLLQTAASLRPSLLELWGSLLHGSTLALSPDAPGSASASALALTIRQFGVSTICLSVSALHDLVDHAPRIFSSLNNLVIEIEHDGKVSTLSPQRLQWLANNHPRLRICSTYGTVETSGYATSFLVPRGYVAQASVPIGGPIEGMHAIILDRELFPAREGELGELAFAGDGVVNGYLRDPDATAGRFLRSTERGSAADAHLFLTGERARRRSDGLLELHGRSAPHIALAAHLADSTQRDVAEREPMSTKDFNAADVEAMLMSQQGIRDAAIVEKFDDAGSRRHIAFIAFDRPNVETGRVPAEAGLKHDAQAQLSLEDSMRNALPQAAMPSAFRYVEHIPRNAHGDPDHALLEQQWAIENDREEYQQRLEKKRRAEKEQETETLNQVRRIWLRLLQRVSVGCDEDFLEAGGTPVQMIRMHVELNRLFPGAITMANLSVLSTIRRIHQHLTNYLKQSAPTLTRRGA